MIDQAQFLLALVLIASLAAAGVATLRAARLFHDLSRVEVVLLGGCLVLALVTRLAARTFLGDFQLASAQGYSIGPEAHRWGAGYSALLHLLFLVLPASVASVAKLNVVVGVATVALVFVFVKEYFADRLAAFAAAIFVAVQPISVRYAASDIAHVSLTFSLLAGLIFLHDWRRRLGRLSLWQGVGWLALAANIRYEGGIYVVAGALVVLATPGALPRGSLRSLAGALAVYALVLAYPALLVLRDAGEAAKESLSGLGAFEGFFLSPHSPAVIAVLGVIGLVRAGAREPRRGLLLGLVLVVVSWPCPFLKLESSDLSSRYLLPHLAIWGAFAGLGFSAAWAGVSALLGRAAAGDASETPLQRAAVPWLAVTLAIVLAVAAAIPHRAFWSKMWTYALEYDFIVEAVAGIPDDCVIVSSDLNRVMRGLRPRRFLSLEAGRRHPWIAADDPGVERWLQSDTQAARAVTEACFVFYQSSGCFAYEGDPSLPVPTPAYTPGAQRAICRSVRERLVLEPLATASIPVVPYANERYVVDPIPVGFYRLRARDVFAGNETR